MDTRSFLAHTLRLNNQLVSAEIQEKYLAYLALLQHWNRVFNLTAIREIREGILLHIIDSLSIQTFITGQRIIDVGTGAGLPGIPLALFFPEKEFVLLDSNSKKTRFLTQAICELGIKNVAIVHERAEHFQDACGFDHVITRAFASLDNMLAATEHLLATDGQFLAMKGLYPANELQNIAAHLTVAVHKLVINGLNAERHAICISRNPKGE